ncbi:non-hydrolyzing UDP-N-acetylglucosamine 2-epimerase [Alteribacillus sp. YIM 98480]|uniref:non-hydrolyzing UDP-N-acetylglucosamine 2-epimerase n=1 Tax=Alteribacillus sp. YIM 98480 TaxID=2606599 RepID=UPI00131D9530|nr:UDP-N-acetylglucosamine 2-epimerase (non-hydrolyzing) [Alteribacillus sp. YIM 98480]
MKILTVVGARPQFVKACMLSRKLRSQSIIKEVIVHTGQHYNHNMSDAFFSQLALPKPDHNLGIGSDKQGKQTARMLSKIEEVLLSERPDIVLVYGDTNSTLAGSLAASKHHIPVAHVEAGLRSFNKKMPEEINRVLTDHMSTLLFCPTQTAVENLEKEGIRNEVYMTGDIMYDAILHYKSIALHQSNICARLNIKPKNYYLVTVHRAENTDDPHRLRTLLKVLTQLNENIVFPLHPRTKQRIKHWNLLDLLSSKNIKVIEPINYFDMLTVESHAKAILTDSGGVQKEAYMLRTPCITLRDETEWIETVQAGWNHVTGVSDSQTILDVVRKTIVPKAYPNLFGNGDTSETIYKILCKKTGKH